MKKFLTPIRDWFTAGRRVALYAVALALLPLLQRLGVVEQSAIEPWLIIIQAALQVLAGLLMLANLTWQDAATWFQRGGRAAIYTLGGFVAPALTTLGYFTPVQAENALQTLSDVLAIAAALLAALYITPSPTPARENPDGSFDVTSLPDF
ncbi:hypothetical protein GCM10009775_04780 [Microbacterium aoyamense]|uniref:Holin n=1 Tax=Microbacterium aoyamense TaxID=344166 RepID=A0ABN2P8J4_9MICO|nr:hypothetical protein [Microbacterium aoyamense]